MIRHAAKAAILDASRQKILLHKREDFRAWELPGGMVEKDETFDNAAIREVKEETGLDVEVVRHIADFHRPQTHEMIHLYECRVIGGEIIKQGYETLDVDWFTLTKLPKPLMRDTNRYLDAVMKNQVDPIQETIIYSRLYVFIRHTAIWIRNLRNRYLR